MTILHTIVKMCDIVITVCWQACRDLRERTAVVMSKGCHDVELRKQHLSYHDWWDCFVFHIACMSFGYCTVLMLAVLTDGTWKLAATYCNTIRCDRSGMML